MTKRQHHITITAHLDDEFIDDVLTTGAGYIGYWCDRMSVSSDTGHVEVHEILDEGRLPMGDNIAKHKITFGAIASTLGAIASGVMPARLDLVEAARRAVFGNAAIEVDAELADVIIQYAALGEIRYG